MEDWLIVTNMIRLADHHRQHCDGAACNISLSFMLELFERAGIKLTAEQMTHFV
jgi:hypothetical protein